MSESVVLDLELLRYVLRRAIERQLSFPTGINKVYCYCCYFSPKIYRDWKTLLQQIQIIIARIQLRLCLQCRTAEENGIYSFSPAKHLN